ncbi:transcriptional regulator [candidate division KSB1 bacterium]|nr:MAG: transcriptional regulator [candidate division KSB1 bacterium]
MRAHIKNPINLLFTSVGRRVELLRAFKSAYQALELEGHIIGLDMDPIAPALNVVDRPYVVPRLSHPNYLEAFLQICRHEKIDLIFPLIDPDIPFLAKHRERLVETGAKAVVVPDEAATITTDKWQTGRFFQKLNLAIPKSWLPEQSQDIDVDYPLFIKPRSGSASNHAYKVKNEKELKFFLDYVPDPIIQEYLAGTEITNDVVCDLNGEVISVVSRRRIEVRWGEVAKGITVYDPKVTEACITIAQALHAIGPITVQCIMKDGIPYFTEINARVGGGAPLGIAAGADWPKWLLVRYAGIPIEIPPLGSYETGLHLSRFDDSFFFTEAHVEKMASCHL